MWQLNIETRNGEVVSKHDGVMLQLMNIHHTGGDSDEETLQATRNGELIGRLVLAKAADGTPLFALSDDGVEAVGLAVTDQDVPIEGGDALQTWIASGEPQTH